MKKSAVAFDGISLKLKRAWEQLNTLKTDISAFLYSRPYLPVPKFNSNTKRLTVYVNVNTSPDPMWGVCA